MPGDIILVFVVTAVADGDTKPSGLPRWMRYYFRLFCCYSCYY